MSREKGRRNEETIEDDDWKKAVVNPLLTNMYIRVHFINLNVYRATSR